MRAFTTTMVLCLGAAEVPCNAALAPDELFALVAPTVWRLQTNDAAGKALAVGSAVVIGPELLVTNCHVLKGAAGFEVVQGASKYKGRLLHADAQRDLCQVSVPGVAVSPAVFSGQPPRVGQRIYTIGSPRGFDATLSDGLVSGLRHEADGLSLIQISAPISPGSSGGGLFDDEGRLLGITTAGVGGTAQNINFARPSSQIAEVPARAAAALERWRQTTSAPSTVASVSDGIARELSPRQLSGRLEITDRYGARTSLVVGIAESGDDRVRYTSGDALDASNRAVGVRIGSHVGTVSTGSLWSFPLREQSFGSALVTFDSESVAGKIDWRVERVDGERAVVVADVVMPLTHGSLSASQNRLVGTWRAEYDSTYPIPLNTHFSAREFLASASESTRTSWFANRGP